MATSRPIENPGRSDVPQATRDEARAPVRRPRREPSLQRPRDEHARPFLLRHLFPLCFTLGALSAILPLWCTDHVPAVGWPLHLFQIQLLDRLSDPSAPFADVFAEQSGWTRLVFPWAVHALGRLFGVEIALKLFLSAVLLAIPATLLLLLRALGRNRWLSLLAVPIALTDTFHWGDFDALTAVPPALLTLAALVRALESALWTRKNTLALLGLLAGALLLTLADATAALPLFPALVALFLLTPSERRRRLAALAALLPGLVAWIAWIVEEIGRAPAIPGVVFRGFGARLSDIPKVLSGGFLGSAGTLLFCLWLGALALAVALFALRPRRSQKTLREKSRPWALFALAVAGYALLPEDVIGHAYRLQAHQLQMAALLLIPLLPFPHGPIYRFFAGAVTSLAVATGAVGAAQFHRFDVEARTFDTVAAAIAPQSKIMHLVVNPRSDVARHAVYLHYATLAAARTGGLPSHALVQDAPALIRYREGKAPPAALHDHRPQDFSWREQARFYDVFLVRGAEPAVLFGRDVGRIEPVAEAGGWKLFRRKGATEPAPK